MQIGVFAAGDTDHTGTPIALHNSMTTLAAGMFNGTHQSRSARHRAHDPEQHDAGSNQPDSDGIADVDTAVFSGARAEYDITSMPMAPSPWPIPAVWRPTARTPSAMSSVLDFTDQDISLQAPTLDLHGDVTVTTTTTVAQAYRDTFDTASHNNSNGTVELGDALGRGR